MQSVKAFHRRTPLISGRGLSRPARATHVQTRLSRRSRKLKTQGRTTRSAKRLEGTAVSAKAEGRSNGAAGSGRYAIIVGKFNSLITKALLEGAQGAFLQHDIPEESINVYWAPGSFEIPLLAKTLAKQGRHNAVVCIGAIIRGGTSHYEAVVSAATSGVLQASMDSGVPVIFGILTCDTMEQAFDRAGGKMGNKGYEAAMTAMEMTDLMSKLAVDNMS